MTTPTSPLRNAVRAHTATYIQFFFNFEKTNDGPGPAPAREIKDDPYPHRMCRKKSFAPLSSPFTCCDRVSRHGCADVAVRMARLHGGGVAASGGARRDGATATRRQHSYVGRRGEGWRSC